MSVEEFNLRLVLVFLFFLLHAVHVGGALQTMPLELEAAFTMDGSVRLASFFVDDSRLPTLRYPQQRLDRLMQSANATITAWVTEHDGRAPPDWHTHAADWPLATLLRHRAKVEGRQVVVLGSMEPWAEAALLVLGAAHVTTVDYNVLEYPSPLETLTVPAFRAAVEGGRRWDVAVSLSSFDHDGLGRYGDPIDPDADLAAMALMKRCLQAGGTAVLSLPIGPDLVVWNLHRRYGERRLPLMLQGWTVVDRFAWDAGRLVADASFRRTYEPVFILARVEDEAKQENEKRSVRSVDL